MKKHIFYLAVSLLMLSDFSGFASENSIKKENLAEKDYKLATITVTEKKPGGEINLNKFTLNLLPDPGQSVTGALRGESSVQFDSTSLDVLSGGAITPPKISIRGAHHYENNFTINGMSNNSVLNPSGFDEGESFGGFLPSGDSQAMFISTELLDSISAYTENISAAYGDFLGGVVDGKYRNAAKDKWHVSLRTRHTRDQWAEQHYLEDNEPDEYPVSQDGEHPRFKKTNASIILEGPISNNSGVILAYDRKWSKIPTYMILNGPEETTDYRTNENYFIRLNSTISDNLTAAVTGTYAPYSAEKHPMFQKGGEYDIKGGGYGLNLETQWKMSAGSWENTLAFSSTEVSKDSNSNVGYQWLSKPGGVPSTYANWTNRKYANVGMMGDWDSEQKVWELKSHFRVQEFDTSTMRHKILTGLDLKSLKAEAETNGYTTYSKATAQSGVGGSLADGVVSGEQYAAMKFVVPANSRSQNYETAALFVEDSIEMGRALVRPGLRASWDSITEDCNLAPRLFVNVDIFNDKQFHFFGGYNRYYGSQIMKKAINLPMQNQRFTRKFDPATGLGDWKPGKSFVSIADQLGDLDTPYVNEYTAGASALVMDTLFDITYVNRGYKDQIRTYYDSKKRYNTCTNEGRTKYWGVTLNIKKVLSLGSFGEHRCELAATRSSTKSNYAQWLDSFDEKDFLTTSDYVELNGKMVVKADLPTGNFAAPWVITYSQEMRFWDGRFRVMPVMRYEAGGETLLRLRGSVIAPDGKKADRYSIKDRSDTFNVDLSAEVDVLVYKRNMLTVEMDITNLFDRRNLIDVNPDHPTYAMGRQFYLGLKYTF